MVKHLSFFYKKFIKKGLTLEPPCGIIDMEPFGYVKDRQSRNSRCAGCTKIIKKK